MGAVVSDLRLDNNQLSGTIPSTISALTSLTYVHFLWLPRGSGRWRASLPEPLGSGRREVVCFGCGMSRVYERMMSTGAAV